MAAAGVDAASLSRVARGGGNDGSPVTSTRYEQSPPQTFLSQKPDDSGLIAQLRKDIAAFPSVIHALDKSPSLRIFVLAVEADLVRFIKVWEEYTSVHPNLNVSTSFDNSAASSIEEQTDPHASRTPLDLSAGASSVPRPPSQLAFPSLGSFYRKLAHDVASRLGFTQRGVILDLPELGSPPRGLGSPTAVIPRLAGVRQADIFMAPAVLATAGLTVPENCLPRTASGGQAEANVPGRDADRNVGIVVLGHTGVLTVSWPIHSNSSSSPRAPPQPAISAYLLSDYVTALGVREGGEAVDSGSPSSPHRVHNRQTHFLVCDLLGMPYDILNHIVGRGEGGGVGGAGFFSSRGDVLGHTPLQPSPPRMAPLTAQGARGGRGGGGGSPSAHFVEGHRRGRGMERSHRGREYGCFDTYFGGEEREGEGGEFQSARYCSGRGLGRGGGAQGGRRGGRGSLVSPTPSFARALNSHYWDENGQRPGAASMPSAGDGQGSGGQNATQGDGGGGGVEAPMGSADPFPPSPVASADFSPRRIGETLLQSPITHPPAVLGGASGSWGEEMEGWGGMQQQRQIANYQEFQQFQAYKHWLRQHQHSGMAPMPSLYAAPPPAVYLMHTGGPGGGQMAMHGHTMGQGQEAEYNVNVFFNPYDTSAQQNAAMMPYQQGHAFMMGQGQGGVLLPVPMHVHSPGGAIQPWYHHGHGSMAGYPTYPLPHAPGPSPVPLVEQDSPLLENGVHPRGGATAGMRGSKRAMAGGKGAGV